MEEILALESRLDARTIVITGGTSGIGKETARQLAALGARVIIGCRNPERGAQVVREITTPSGQLRVEARQLDLSSFESIRRFAADFRAEVGRLQVLVNNAGVIVPDLRKTRDGFELQIGVNHLGHFLLTNLLLDLLKDSAPTRVVHVSSRVASKGTIDLDSFRGERTYGALTAYLQSKLANVLFSNRLARDLAGTGITSNALHPGGIRTNILREMNPLLRLLTKVLARSPVHGAKTSVYLAASPDVAEMTGEFFVNRRPISQPASFLDESMGELLWEHSRRCCGI